MKRIRALLSLLTFFIPTLLIHLLLPVSATLSGSLDTSLQLSVSGGTGAGDWSASGSTITGRITGITESNGWWSTYDTQNDSITVTNDGEEVTLTIAPTVTVNGIQNGLAGGTYPASLTISGTDKNGNAVSISPTYSEAATNDTPDPFVITLAKGGSITIKLQSSRNADNYISVSLALSAPRGNTYDIKLIAPVSAGSSYTVGTKTMNAGDTDYTVEDVPEAGIALSAPTIDGLRFVEWRNLTNDTQITDQQTGTFKPTADSSITAVYVASDTPGAFSVGGVTYYTWESAFSKASADIPVILIAAYTLPDSLGGNGLPVNGKYVYENDDGNIVYSVPSNVTFHIPYDDAHTGLTHGGYPQKVTQSSETAMPSDQYPSQYAPGKLTLQADSIIEAKGTIIVNGKQYITAMNMTGSAIGPHGLINLSAATSKIELLSGSTMYCYGYIVGSGTVEACSGSTVYELMQMRDWRGGTATVSWLGTTEGNIMGEAIDGDVSDLQKNHRSFIFSQYYVQNIESKFQINHGATVNTALAVRAQSSNTECMVPFISSVDKGTGFLQTKNGHLLREYNEDSDRIVYTVNGDADLVSIKVTVRASILAEVPLDTTHNIFALNGNITINVASGKTLTFTEDLQLLPEAIIDVKTGGNLVLDGCDVYIWDHKDWTDGKYTYTGDIFPIHYSASRENGKPFGRSIANSARINVDGTLTVNSDAHLYTTNINSNTDKIVTGRGQIISYATYSDDDADGNYGDLDGIMQNSDNSVSDTPITSIPVVGRLLGITDHITGTYNSFGSGTAEAPISYYGLGDIDGSGKVEEDENYWYNHLITLDPVDAIVNDGIILNNTNSAMSNHAADAADYVTVTPYQRTAVEDVIGFVTYYWNGTESIQSDFTFTVDGYEVSLADITTATLGDGSLTNINADTKIKLIAPFKVQMVLGNALDMRFAFPADYVNEGGYAVIDKEFADNRTFEPQTIYCTDWKPVTINGVQYYYFTFSDISAKEMSDKIHVTIYDASNERISAKYTESVRNYVTRILENQNALAKTMLVDMLNYGAAAQIYFEYGTDDLAYSLLTDTQKAYATQELEAIDNEQTAGDNFNGSRLELTESIKLQMAFDGLTEDMYATIEFTNHHGPELTFENVKPVTASDDALVILINQIVVADGRRDVTVTVYSADGTLYGSATDSVAAYVNRNMDKDNNSGLFEMILKFSDSAYEYLHQESTTAE